MIQKEFTTTVPGVTCHEVWNVISDINNWKRWDTGVEDAELMDEFKTGSFFMLKPKGGPEIKIKLVEVTPNRYFKDMTSFPLAKMYGEHWYEETTEGLKITVRVTITGILSPLWYAIVMKDIVAGLQNDAKRLVDTAKNKSYVS